MTNLFPSVYCEFYKYQVLNLLYSVLSHNLNKTKLEYKAEVIVSHLFQVNFLLRRDSGRGQSISGS